MRNKRAVVLLSGGLDSATTLYYAKSKGYDCLCLTFDYGQTHKKEIGSAKKIAKLTNSKLLIIKFKLPWKGSALLDTSIKIQSMRRLDSKDIPATYVPARNTILLSFALSCAEANMAQAIFIGANQIDFSGYPDCRPKFFKEFEGVIRQGTRAGVSGRNIKILTPLINKTKADIVRLAARLDVPLELTWSCYKGGKRPCGVCDSCRLRAKGIRQANLN